MSDGLFDRHSEFKFKTFDKGTSFSRNLIPSGGKGPINVSIRKSAAGSLKGKEKKYCMTL